jgi:hypothetical protein
MISIRNLAASVKEYALELTALSLFGLVLTTTVIPAAFINDENNYLVTAVGLRNGRLTVPGTEGLTPSRELVYFDPEPNRRSVLTTPVVSLVPPLYAFAAVPFAIGGWRGLVMLNTISFLVAIALVYFYVKDLTQHVNRALLASLLFSLGGYCIEYAQGVWPHMLSVALCLGSLYLSMKGQRSERAWIMALGGLCVGLAVGVREQNIVFALFVGIGLLILEPKKFRIVLTYALGLGIPLVAIATLNYFRLGIWHPIPKSMGYVELVSSNIITGSSIEPLRVFWAKVVDYSSFGSGSDHFKSGLYQRDPLTGAVLLNGIVKKAWIQSSPWLGLSFVGLLVAWTARYRKDPVAQQELKRLSLIVLPFLFMFTIAGFNRTDGISYNQRYFLELLPLCSIAVAILSKDITIRWLHIVAGGFVGMLLVVVVLLARSHIIQYAGQLYLPLVIGMLLLVAWFRFRKTAGFQVLLGISIGWALFVHLESDLVGSRSRREMNRQRYEILKKVIPSRSALFAYWGNKDAAGALQLAKDVIILDVWADDGADAPHLVDQLRRSERRIFIIENDIPTDILSRMMTGGKVRRFSEGIFTFDEVLD